MLFLLTLTNAAIKFFVTALSGISCWSFLYIYFSLMFSKTNGNDCLQRYEIVNGATEVEGVTTEAAAEKEEDKEADGTQF